MPVFHTKTIEGILEPVAQQVERLVILHEEAEDGNAMPDLERPVQAVSSAVTNLIKVGKETINSSEDAILKQDMPVALHRVENASKLLVEASSMLKADPYSGPARKKLIEGARGILQGTSALLLCFDESEVRKIIRECRKVLDYLAVAEVIETMEDLVQFVKDLSPCLTKLSRDVDAREKDLTHQFHREILVRCLEQVKTLAPILICSMKMLIQIMVKRGKGEAEAAANRNYVEQRMTDEINEIIRVLQLTTYDEDEWDADNLTVMKKIQNAINGKMQSAVDWLGDPLALKGGVGEKSLRQMLEHATRVAERSLPSDGSSIRKLCGDIGSMTDALCELRHDGKGASPQAQSLARGIQQKLHELNGLVARAVTNIEKSGIQQPAHTVTGRIDQAQRWILNPTLDDKGLGVQAVQLVAEEGRKVAEGLQGIQKKEIIQLCNEVDSLGRQLSDLVHEGQGNSPQAKAVARLLSSKLHELKYRIQSALVNRVVEDFIDVTVPLKQFTDAVLAPEGTPNREVTFNDKGKALQEFSTRASKTARMVAAGGCNNKKLAEALLSSAWQVECLTPQLINAGLIRMSYPQNKAADEHFENLRKQYAESIQKMRNLADEATDKVEFVKASEDAIRRHTNLCEDAIASKVPQKMVDNTSSIARLANRVLMVAKQESDNSEDPYFIDRVTPMVQDAKSVALNINDTNSITRWRDSNRMLINAVGAVRQAVTPDELPPSPDIDKFNISAQRQPPLAHPPKQQDLDISELLNVDFDELFNQNQMQRSSPSQYQGIQLPLRETAPPRPPLPLGEHPPPRPPPPETDDEDEIHFPVPQANQPIMMAAHGLRQEVRQWSSKDNDLVAAAKKMAVLMYRLSQLVRGEGGSKKELIACAKAIAEASEEVTRLAKLLARQCTDKRMRTNLLQVCERIPTIGTQLKILTTVKATMLGVQGTEEDQEATEMLVGNAQNLMQSVKETVRAAEAASIKIRTDAGIRLRWVRNTQSGIYTIHPRPWYGPYPFQVYCDMKTDGGGWTMFQRRDDYEIRQNFFRNWTDYRIGFGDLDKEFWLGNDHLYILTNQDRVTLRVDLEDFEGNARYAEYKQFQISDNRNNYKAVIAEYQGDAGE
uniref:Vinculin n=1 Tax=Strigamia maritima TaxID=126957 RepID=T1JBN5_STRMM